uniref:Uncharacterized protein n=1 Tax=Arundo donax TaxID=35708 RepID=A0A0A8ZMN3_ARUDO
MVLWSPNGPQIDICISSLAIISSFCIDEGLTNSVKKPRH